VISWKRYWVPIGGSISCGEDQGFLDDPESELGGQLNPAVCELDTIMDRSPLVLCGEPGIGKTTVLQSVRAKIEGANASSIWVELRSVPDAGTFLRRTVETETWKEWQNSEKGMALVIDGVDEGLMKIPDFVSFLRDELKPFDLRRLQLIVVCRVCRRSVNAHKEHTSDSGGAYNKRNDNRLHARSIGLHGEYAYNFTGYPASWRRFQLAQAITNHLN
jgi:hypothetical protein